MKQAPRRLLLGVGLFAIGLAWTGAAPMSAACAASPHAGLVLRSPNGHVSQACVAIPAEGLDAVAFLRVAGHDVDDRDYGGTLGVAVCSVDGAGSTTSDCPSASGHWHLWQLDAKLAWADSVLGGSSVHVRSGGTWAWVWQPRGKTKPPPAPSLAARCLLGVTAQGTGRPLRPRAHRSPLVPALLFGGACAAVGLAVKSRR